MQRLVVIGSINMDLVSRVADFPRPGETVHGQEAACFAGGKGANQAVAAARSGGNVAFVGAVGTDPFGRTLVDGLASHGIDTRHVMTKEGSSGLALITVNETGENCIVLSGGSNRKIRPSDIVPEQLDQACAVLVQNEIPWDVNVQAFRLCRSLDIPVICNPAPAMPLPEDIFPLIHTLVVNETEASLIGGSSVDDADSARAAGAHFLSKGISRVIITLGSKGCVYVSRDEERFIPAFPMKAVDTTAAGDTFIGAYAAAAMQHGMSVPDALRFASAAAAIAVTREGAQASIPTREETEALLQG